MKWQKSPFSSFMLCFAMIIPKEGRNFTKPLSLKISHLHNCNWNKMLWLPMTTLDIALTVLCTYLDRMDRPHWWWHHVLDIWRLCSCCWIGVPRSTTRIRWVQFDISPISPIVHVTLCEGCEQHGMVVIYRLVRYFGAPPWIQSLMQLHFSACMWYMYKAYTFETANWVIIVLRYLYLYATNIK